MLRMRLQPPCAYQGGKRRQAPEIVRHMGAHAARDVPFVELCCGGAAVSLELISRGKPPELVTLVDAGPWGLFWQAIGEGFFDVERMESIVRGMPEPCDVPAWMREQTKTRCGAADVPYLFPLLQAASFGGKAVGWSEEIGWRSHGFIPHGKEHPTAMSCPPWVLLERVRKLAGSLRGISAFHDQARPAHIGKTGTVYIDPPYAGATGYGGSLSDPVRIGIGSERPCYVSERVALEPGARRILGRVTSKLSGRANVDTSEYLSLFNAEWTTPEPVVKRVEQTSLF